MSPVVVPCANACVCAFLSCAETSTLVMSQPWRPPEMLVALKALALRVPKVPLVSSVPSSRLICEAKKLVCGLFGPFSWFAVASGVAAPNSIVSPLLLASPSIALTASRPESFPPGGVQKPLVDAGAAPDSSEPTKRARLRTGRAKLW